jgi:hypothetical protein
LSVITAVLGAVANGAGAQTGGKETTRVTPHMQVPITTGQNVVYCSTFQIAWNDMKDDIVGEDIRLEKPLALVDRLNRSLSTRADISEVDYVAEVGVASDTFIDDLNRALRAKFGGDAPIVGDEYKNEEAILAYAFFTKDLRFDHPFDVLGNPITFYGNGGRSFVQAFGIGGFSAARHGQLRDQVEIVDYEGMGDFVIRLRSTRPDEDIVLANVRHRETLLATYEAVEARVKRSKPTRLAENDVLMIPMLDVSVHRSYHELLDLYLLNDGFEEYFVDEALQDVHFQMNERGVSVDSEAKLVLEKKGPPPDHKLLVCNTPFMLYLKQRDGKYPYFAIWVANQELIVPSN